MKASKASAKCKQMIVAAVGPGGFEAFLKARQPALDEKTGAELLKSEPSRLLQRLRERENGGGIHDE